MKIVADSHIPYLEEFLCLNYQRGHIHRKKGFNMKRGRGPAFTPIWAEASIIGEFTMVTPTLVLCWDEVPSPMNDLLADSPWVDTPNWAVNKELGNWDKGQSYGWWLPHSTFIQIVNRIAFKQLKRDEAEVLAKKLTESLGVWLAGNWGLWS